MCVLWTLHMCAHVVVSEYSSVSQNHRCYWIPQAERFPGNSDVPFSSDFGDLETKVHGVEVGGLPFQDVVTPSRLVPLWRNPNPNKITMWQTLWNKNT